MISLKHADKYYNRGRSNELHVMNDVTLELPERGMIAIFGKSGCGKTTLLNAIGGLDKIGSGEITLFGHNIANNTDEIRNKYTGYIFQNYNLSKKETVFENVADALRLCGMTDPDEIYGRVIAALSNVGMEKFKNRLPETLSGGQQQRVAIARALVKNPAVILADEPTGNLDEANTVLVMDILKEVSRDHLVLLVTHEAHLVDDYCDRVIEIVDGAVCSVRDNEGADGYVSRDSNDIYLGELEHHTGTLPGIRIEYYGSRTDEIKLKIVNAGGQLYLQSDTPHLKILDGTSEVRLRDGVFEETPKQKRRAEDGAALDMSHLKPFEGKRFGRLFTFRSSLKSGYRENFSGKRKAGKLLLRASMFLLAAVAVFMTARFAVSFRSLSKVRGEYGENVFYLPLTSETDVSAITQSIGQNGIDYACVTRNYLWQNENVTFTPGRFMTANLNGVFVSGMMMDAALAKDLPVAAGTTEQKQAEDIIVTTALADDMIANCGMSCIKDYKDLIGMTAPANYGNGTDMRVAGVVKSDEKVFYLSGVTAAEAILFQQYTYNLPVYAASRTAPELTPSRGEVAVKGAGCDVGENILIMGRFYRVSQVIDPYVSETEDPPEYEEDPEFMSSSIGYYNNAYYLCDEDYISLTYSVGKNSQSVCDWDMFNVYTYDDGVVYSRYMLIHASDTGAAQRYLTEHYGDAVVTPGQVYRELLSECRAEIVGNLIGLAVALALICLCVYFIMRSSLMSRVKEIGIYRAIGVSKKNMTFRFTVEAMVLATIALLPGFILSGALVMKLAGMSITKEVFYFPVWLGIALLALLYLVTAFFGILPVCTLMRRTPSEILAKYDI